MASSAEAVQSPGDNQRHAASQGPLTGLVSTSRRTLPRWVLPSVLMASCAFLYLQLFSLPSTPRDASNDQAIYLEHAARMVNGELIYRDFDHFTLPGTDVLYTVLFRLFGVRTWVPQAMLILVGTLIAWLSTVIAKQLLPGFAVFLPGSLFLVFAYSSYLDATHHWYSTLAATAALAVVVNKRTVARIGCAGFLWGLGTCFTQSVVLGVLGMAAFLAWEGRRAEQGWRDLLRNEIVLFASVLITVGTFCSYFIWQVGLRRFLYFTVVFVAKYYPADRFNNWRVYLTGRPAIHRWMNWPDLAGFVFIHALIPLIYVLFFVRYRSERQKASAGPWNQLMLVNLVGTGLFLSVAGAPAYSRLCTVSLPALVLLVWFLMSTSAFERTLLRTVWATVLIGGVARPTIAQVRPKQFLDTPTGRMAFITPILYEKCKWVSERTAPFDYFSGDQNVAFALRLRTAGRVSFLRPTEYTRPEEVDDLLRALENHHVRFVSWYAGLDREGLLNPAGDHLGPLRLYLHQHYRVATVFSNGDKIWERNQDPTDSR